MPAEIPGFESFYFKHDGVAKKVYWSGDPSKPPILLMHELPGMIPQCVALAKRLEADGFTVFMPLLFGRPNATPLDMPAYLAQVCIRHEFSLLAMRKSSAITNWLRALCREAKRRCDDQGCGVIGMCLTGGFALTLMADDSVLAPVMSQPSLPLGITPARRRDLGVSPDVLERSLARAKNEGVPLLAMRFTGDVLCPPERFDELQRVFGDRFRRIDIDSSIGNAEGNPPWAHSVLTVHYNDAPEHSTRLAYETMRAFFNDCLRCDQ